MNTIANTENVIEVYIGAGWTPCPVKTRAKQPVYPGWPQTDRSEALNLFEANPGCNIGIVLGDASNGIVDLDLDDMVAVKVAPTIMPDTGVRFGRASKTTSHYIYAVVDAGRVERFVHPKTEAMLVELRGMAIIRFFPGSFHPSGEHSSSMKEPMFRTKRPGRNSGVAAPSWLSRRSSVRIGVRDRVTVWRWLWRAFWRPPGSVAMMLAG